MAEKRVVAIRARGRGRIEAVAERALVGEELPLARHGGAVVALDAPRLRVVEEEPPALRRGVGLVRVLHELRERVDEVRDVRQPDAGDDVRPCAARKVAVRRREVVVHIDGIR